MADYIYVPKVSDVYTEGAVIFSRDGIGDYRTGYISDSVYSIKLGLYQSNSNLHFVYAANQPVRDINISVVIPSSESVIDITEIGNTFDGGYYVSRMYTVVPSISNVTVFNTLGEVLDAMAYPLPPSDDSGVVVTVIASPVETPPVTEGVVVYAIARLLDPNQQGGTSTTGGGDGTFDETSDAIPVPNLPDISTVDTGLVTLFRPTRQEVAALGSYLWTNFTDFIENLQKLFTNPMDYFIAFNIFPVSPVVTNARNIYIGNWATNISMPPVANQWYEFDCGTVTLQKYWGSALDYAPNTKVQLMLPYIGSVQLNTDEVMGQQIGVKYRIDLLSGSCVAMVTVNGNVYYQFTGECAVAVPLTGADWSRVYSAVIGAVGTAIVGGVGVAAASGVASTGGLVAARSYEAAAAAGSSYAAINETSKGIKGVAEMRQRMLDVSAAAIDNARNAANRNVRRSEGVRNMRLANTANNTVGQVMGAKTAISHSGTISGSAGMLGVRDAYLIVEYPNQSLAKDYKHFAGYPSNIYAKLETLNGYTECEQVIPSGIWGTDDELAEIVEALKGGVYL